jgi:cytochrome P450
VAKGFDIKLPVVGHAHRRCGVSRTFTVNRGEELPVQIRQATLQLTRSLEESGGVAKALDVEPFLASAPTQLAATRGVPAGL